MTLHRVEARVTGAHNHCPWCRLRSKPRVSGASTSRSVADLPPRSEWDGGFLGLWVQVPELPGTGDRGVDEVPDKESPRHVRFVDPAVVPVGRPVATALDRGGIVRID